MSLSTLKKKKAFPLIWSILFLIETKGDIDRVVDQYNF